MIMEQFLLAKKKKKLISSGLRVGSALENFIQKVRRLLHAQACM